MKITDIKTGFPLNKTLKFNLETEFNEFSLPSILEKIGNSPVKLKLVIDCTAEDKNAPMVKRTIEDLNKCDKIKSVVTVFNTIKPTNIRSEAIIGARTNEDKLKEYYRINNLEWNDRVSMRLKEIEDNLDIKYFTPNKSFTLLKIDLRGAIGIKEGTGRDEVSVNFKDYMPGIITLCGHNGGGKSTLLENMSPYPRLLTRSGTLQNHFFLKDSYRKLLYVDNEGTYYKIELLIDGKTDSGKVKYLVYTGKDIDNLEPVGECNGNSEPYEKWVNRTFGPIELFLRTCFFTKEQTSGIPDISRATKGQKKELFTNLLGIDGLSEISAAAKEKEKHFSGLKDEYADKLESLEGTEECIESFKAKIDSEKENINQFDSEINELKSSLDIIKKELESLDTKVIDEKKYRIETLSDMVEHMESIKSEIADFESKEEDFNVALEMNKLVAQLESKRDPVCDELKELKEKRDSIDSLISTVKSTAAFITDCINNMKLTLPTELDDKCPVCGQVLPKAKLIELKETVKANNEKINLKELELKTNNDKLVGLEKELKDLNSMISNKNLEIEKLTEEITEADKEIKGYTTQYIEYMMNQYKKNKLVDLSAIDAMKKEIESLSVELKKIQENSSSVSDLKKNIADIEHEIKSAESDKSNSLELIGKYKGEVELLEDSLKYESEYKDKLKEYSDAVLDYSIMTKAFGKDGIQALELEALSPEIASITNEILRSAYGDRFSISFRTLREGASKNMIEDFSILVNDTETGTERPLEWLSSGESIWIKEALYNAFTAARIRSTGFAFRTRFLDETDGSLDSNARMMFLKMLQATHKSGDVVHTVLITHSQEIKDIVTQRIEMC